MPDLEREADKLEAELDHAEFQLMLSGPYDRCNAILAIHAGAGGTDSQDWAAMLLRMFLRWAEQRQFKTEILDSMEGEGAGIKSVTVGIAGKYAFGYLRSERGVHRLVRISPFDSQARRHTSFAGVDVWPEVDDNIEIDIRDSDIERDSVRLANSI